ncbi:Uncharacterized protein Rs2_02922 [Raphanus sativus]|nr:Uncharacterized protein Rs2_02922 [Raphanus sativus]
MSDQNLSSSHLCRRRRLGEIDNPFGESNRFCPQAPLVSFEDRIHSSRLIYSETLPTIGGSTRRHYNNKAAIMYNYLCLRGFVVQGSLDPNDLLLADVFRVIDRLGWSYTVLHVQPFSPRVVREFISNKLFDDEGSLIRGNVYHF